jgi:hypothetical protein
MKIKKIKVPIYNTILTIVISKNLDGVSEKFNLKEDLSEYSAITIDEKDGSVVVAFSDIYRIKDIAHEVVHIKNYIFRNINQKLDVDNDEAEAYLTTWLFNYIYKFFKKNKMKKHINEIKLKGNDKFTEQFNLCSDYYQKSQNKSLTKEEREKYLDQWFQERQRLELGMY